MSRTKKEESTRPYQEILELQIEQGTAELERPVRGLLFSSLSAGLDIGFSILFIAAMATLIEDATSPIIERLLLANMYSIGFIFVVFGRSELFTEHTTLAAIPVLHNRAPYRSLWRLWALVYIGNLVGALVFARIVVTVGPALGTIKLRVFEELAWKVVDHGWWVIVLSAILAGWLMGLLSWLVSAGRDTVGQILFVWLITAGIGFAELHHSIVGSVEVLAGIMAGESITLSHFFYFLVWTTLGNAIGGVFFVAIIKSAHAFHTAPAET